MKDFESKMPISRQIRYYKQSRDNWKENAAQKQIKIREYVQLTRALKKSRDNWKNKAMQAKKRAEEAEQKISELERKLKKLDPSYDSDPSEDEELSPPLSEKAPHHHYQITTISIAVEQFIDVANSYRGISKNFRLFSSYFPTEVPHYSTIKQWVERLGLYALTYYPERRDDWIYILDFTVEWGDKQAFVIYALSQEVFQTQILPSRRGVRPSDGQVLAVEITKTPTALWIKSVLEYISYRYGFPRQIISDHASNLKKGIELFHANHPGIIYTYDVTHALANLLKKELLFPDIFQNFLSDCHHCRKQILQTELAFAAPPRQRIKSRFLNLEALLNWANHVLNSRFNIFFQLVSYQKHQKFYQRLQDKFSWLFSYEYYLPFWLCQIKMIRLLQKQVKQMGLTSSSAFQFEQLLLNFNIPASLNSFKAQLFLYLQQEMPDYDQTLLASSDVLESIFGRYKNLSKRCPLKEIRSLILTIPLIPITLTHNFVKNALNTVSCSHLNLWTKHIFGQSMLSKRKILFQY